MTPEEIAADRAVIDAATEGPWTVFVDDNSEHDGQVGGGVWPYVEAPDGRRVNESHDRSWHDMEFIAAARTGWPRALDALEAAQAEANELRERIADLEGQLAMRGTP